MPDVAERMNKIEIAMQRMIDTQTTKQESDNKIISAIHINIEKLNALIIGDGKSAGLVENDREHKKRLDVFDEKEKNKGKHIWALWLAFVAGFIEFIGRHVFK